MTEELKKTEDTAKVKSTSKVHLLIAFLALIIAIAGVTASGFMWLQLQKIQSESSSDLSSIKTDIFAQQNNLSQIQEKLLNIEDSSISLQEQSAELGNRLQNIAQDVSSITGLNRVDWQISHAEHLARAAHQRLILTSDIDGAFALLDAADKIMAEVNELGVIEVRRAMAQDLITLKVSHKVDVVGLFEKLDALKAQIMNLSLPPQNFQAKEVRIQEMPANADLQTRFAVVMDNAWQLFNSQYETQKLDEPIKPLLSTEQRSYLKQNLNLLMEQAQLAVIKRDPLVFQRIIHQAETWIMEHFRLDTPVGEAVLESLAELKAVELNPAAPDITATIRSLKVFAENWDKEKQIRQQGNSIVKPVSEAENKEVVEDEVSVSEETNSETQASEQEVPKS